MRDAVGEVHVRGGQIDFQDGDIREARPAKLGDILFRQGARINGQLSCVVEHGPIRRRKPCPLPACQQRVYKFLVFGEAEQTCPVMLDSIMATVCNGNHNYNHLPLCSAELSSSMHGRVIGREVSLQNLRRETVDFENVSQGAGASALLFINALEVARGIVLVDGSDPRHTSVTAIS